ncbi:SAM-dependent methyltransferase [Saccharothrix syringae]|uniref:SAM-dependent methyltransferase n=1 Tax=Saccharothrix syringae TaxID=103733 RepID=UPI00069225A9|nr:SAM-dependent methyltransferase [Saccharothrix syringae]
MSDRDDTATADFDRPNAARIHDWLLGGTLNTPIDRDAAATALTRAPALRELARAGRTFLHRAVQHMLDAGIRQFLDLGAGLPTMTPTHRIAHRHDPAIPVVYVDHDPATTARTNLLLDDTPTALGIHADLRHPDRVLDHPDTRRLLHPTQPTGLLAVDILDTLPDHDRPGRVLQHYLDALPSGSIVALTHLTAWPLVDTAASGDIDHPSADWWRRHPRTTATVHSWLTRLTPLQPDTAILHTDHVDTASTAAPNTAATVVTVLGRTT